MNAKLAFSPIDVKWIKSITQDNGQSWAYLNKTVGDTFELNFSKNPKWYPTNYLKAKPKEIIVLFQSYHDKWYVTHLVSPVDAEIGISNNKTHPYIRTVVIIGISNNPNSINHKDWSFFKCNRGQICDIKTIEFKNGSDYSIPQKQNFIWSLFNDIDSNLKTSIASMEQDHYDSDLHVIEGIERTILKLHKFKERDPKITIEAKRLARQKNKFYCEVCEFNFETYYPELGNEFIECHHKIPISTGGMRKTTVNDLAIVCANCHRMAHRKDKNGNYLTIDELKKLIENNKKK